MSGKNAISPPAQLLAPFELEVASCMAEVSHDRRATRAASVQLEQRRIRMAEKLDDQAAALEIVAAVAASVHDGFLGNESGGELVQALAERVSDEVKILQQRAQEVRVTHRPDDQSAAVLSRLAHLRGRSRG